MTDTPLKTWLDRNGALLRLRLNRPKANIVDSAMITALDTALDSHAQNNDLKAVLIDHAGPNFSFGASIEEHFPDQMAAMVNTLHGLIKRMLDYPCPILVVVQGQCLGGGLEIALAGDLIFANPDAKLGQPEIKLGVFAPAASCLLPERIGQGAASDMLLSGRSIGAEEALGMRLIDFLGAETETKALNYFDTHFMPLSASALRYAVTAVRVPRASRLGPLLDRVELLCGQDLVRTSDALEGLVAFQEKRPPKWRNC